MRRGSKSKDSSLRGVHRVIIYPVSFEPMRANSQDTAYRDILDLLERGALRRDAGGGT
jgi:hypothetical protein